ncbi:MAG TPA: hypothetical protein VHD81_04230 [Mycobacteriales bacterium]|nr:hypothetical protein [Mycobacteriales bacterium]
MPEPARSEVSRVVAAYLAKQVDRDPPRNIAVAIALDLGVTDEDKLVAISAATAFGGLHSLLLDDLVDNKGQGRPWTDVYVAHLLYVLHSDMLQVISPVDWASRGRNVAHQCQIETYRALLDEELNHVGRTSTYGSASIVWEKCAPIKSVVERILSVTDRYEHKDAFDQAADAACFALCTLDDMLDWPDDYDRQRFTYPIQRAIEAANLQWSPAVDGDVRARVAHELLYGVTHHSLMGEIVRALDRAIGLTKAISPSLSTLLEASRTSARASWIRHISYLQAVEDHLRVNGTARGLVTT